jgi:hypothetical protein
LDTNLTTTTSPPAARSLHEICEAARRGSCGPFCGALPGDECVFTTVPVSVPVTKDTPLQPARGYHVSRFAWAKSHGLISAAEFAAVTGAAGSFTPAAVIYDTVQGGAISGDRRVLGPFETAPEALLALRPAERSFVAPESRLGLLTETLRAAGVELGEWDREVARWLTWTSRPSRRSSDGSAARAANPRRCHRPGARRRDRVPDRADLRLPGLRGSRARGLRGPSRGRSPRRRVRAGAALPGHRAGGAVMDAGAVSRRPVPPGLGGAAHQLVLTTTQDLRDVAVPCTCLRASGQDPRTWRCSLSAR